MHSAATDSGDLLPEQQLLPPRQQLGLGTGVEVVRLDRPRCHLDSPFRSPWAAKKANPRLARPPDPGLSQRLGQEAAILAELNHPGIIGYRGLVAADGGGAAATTSGDGPVSLLMQFGGRSLMDWIEERRDEADEPFPAGFIASVVGQAAEALRYLHCERRLLHGDVKSANMLLAELGGRLRLCDFGSALPLNDALEVAADSAAEFRGTELWAAPEALHGDRISHKADLWSLGLVIYELLALDVPHGDIFQEASGCDASADCLDDSGGLDSLLSDRFGTRPPLPDSLARCQNPAQYLGIVQLYNELTATDPGDRPSAVELLERVQPLLHS